MEEKEKKWRVGINFGAKINKKYVKLHQKFNKFGFLIQYLIAIICKIDNSSWYLTFMIKYCDLEKMAWKSGVG